MSQLENYYSEAHRMFPRAKVVASTFEAFFAELETVRSRLPVVTSEIGDTWVDTPPSDPLLAARFRATMRARSRCVAERPAVCNGSDVGSPFYDFSRLYVKNLEHDWGSSQRTGRWRNSELRADTARCHANATASDACAQRISWQDQRAWGTDLALRALRGHPLEQMVRDELAQTVARRPNPLAAGLAPVPRSNWGSQMPACGGTVAFDGAGAISALTGDDGAVYADPTHLLAEPVVHVSSPAQRAAWAFGARGQGAGYMNDPGAGAMFFKLGDPLGSGRGYRPETTAMYRNATAVAIRLTLPRGALDEFGGVAEMWLEYAFAAADGGGCAVDVAYTEVNKTATRVTESHWLRFNPAAAACPAAMRLHKLGSLVDPLDVVFNGSRTLHAVQRGVSYCGDGATPAAAAFAGRHFAIETVDAPVVKVGAGNASLAAAARLDGLNPAPVPNDRPPRLASGVGFNLENNLWNTNGVEWFPYDDQGRSLRYRFRITVPAGRPSCAV